jgi:hypothetical protein
MKWVYKFNDSPKNYYDFPFQLQNNDVNIILNEYNIFKTEKEAVQGFILDVKLNLQYINHYEEMIGLMVKMHEKYANIYPELFI